MRNPRISARILLAVTATFTVAVAVCRGEEIGSGFGLGPGMLLIENVKPGGEKVEATTMETGLFVYNGTEAKQLFSVSVLKATQAIGTWELGYTDLPDASWLEVDKQEVEVPAKSKAPIKLFVKVPNKPEYFNKKWMAVAVCSPGKKQPGVVGLQVATRLQIETLADPMIDVKAYEKSVALVPSICEMPESQPGTDWRVLCKVVNNTADEKTYTIKHLDDVEKDSGKHARYFCIGCEHVISPAWITDSGTFTVKPGEVHPLNLKVNIPASAVRGKHYEELVLLQDEKGKVEFIRARTEIAKNPLKDDK